jgi:hypothetical protein
MLYFFYEGIQKVAYFKLYSFWVGHVPLLKHFPLIPMYAIPIGELLLAVFFMISSRRTWALYGALAGNLVFILYIIWTVLIKGFFFPLYHPWWSHESWFQKLLIALLLIWVSFVLILVENKKLRNSPASS